MMLGFQDADSSVREAISFSTATPLGRKLEKMQEQLLCPICQELFTNPEILPCGHSFCALCIRRHCDPVINRSTADKCPNCRAKADTFDLRRNVTLAETVEHFFSLRDDLASLLTTRGNIPASVSSSSSAPAPSKSGGGTAITIRMTPLSMHNLSKDKVKKLIECTLKDSKGVRLRVDGDKDALERRFKDFVHLHNAQLGAKHPLSLEQVIHQINLQSLAAEHAQMKESKTMASVEKLKNGEETVELSVNFKKLAKEAMKNKKRKLQQISSSESSSSSSSSESATSSSLPLSVLETAQYLDKGDLSSPVGVTASPSSLSQSSGDWSWLSSVPPEETANWQVVFSQKLQRPFFFSVTERRGQFTVPESWEKYRTTRVIETEAVTGKRLSQPETERDAETAVPVTNHTEPVVKRSRRATRSQTTQSSQPTPPSPSPSPSPSPPSLSAPPLQTDRNVGRAMATLTMTMSSAYATASSSLSPPDPLFFTDLTPPPSSVAHTLSTQCAAAAAAEVIDMTQEPALVSSTLSPSTTRLTEKTQLDTELFVTQTTQVTQSTPNPATGSGEWACKTCTFLNPRPAPACSVCTTRCDDFFLLSAKPHRNSRSSTPASSTTPSSAFRFDEAALQRLRQSSSASREKKKHKTSAR